jgi:hypothetical protein
VSLVVDLHHHVIPDFYWEAPNEGGNAAGGITPPRWSLEGAIAYLDEAGIDVAVPSISTPGVHFGDDPARTLARAHAGGTIPFVASRLAIVDAMNVIPGAHERRAFTDTLPRLYWDTASAFSNPVLHMLRSVAGLGNVVFGTDYPYPRDAISIAGLRQLQNTAELDDGEGHAVLGGSAGRLIPRLARSAR